jgi:hypothetical protein
MKQHKISRELVLLATLTALTVFTWLFFDVYRALRKPSSLEVPAEQFLPLDPKLDTKVIESLSGRQMLTREELTLPPEPSAQATNSGETR